MTDQKPSHKIIEAAFMIPMRALYTSSVIPVRPATGGRIEALHGGS